MIQKMNQDKTEDPEITQLNDMLDKIQAIQNQGQTKSITNSSEGKNLSVKNKISKADISILKSDSDKTVNKDTGIIAKCDNGFYSFSTFNNEDDSGSNNSIAAIIPETQTVTAGSTIKLALNNDVTLQNVTIRQVHQFMELRRYLMND